VWNAGAQVVVTGSAALEGELEPTIPDQTLTGGADAGKTVKVVTAFQKLKAGVSKHSLAKYAGDAGVKESEIATLAAELTAPGTEAQRRSRPVLTYRGPVKHTNGTYAQLAIQHINTMMGNYDWKGGCMAGAGGFDHKSAVVKLDEVPGAPGTKGIAIDRHGKLYDAKDAGSLFTGYPAQRPWGPFWTHANYQEVIPSIQDGYPYTMKVLFTYWNAWPYATPGLRNVFEQTSPTTQVGYVASAR
jgi:anaerobic selenocysteine-containing dehydrogenase